MKEDCRAVAGDGQEMDMKGGEDAVDDSECSHAPLGGYRNDVSSK